MCNWKWHWSRHAGFRIANYREQARQNPKAAYAKPRLVHFQRERGCCTAGDDDFGPAGNYIVPKSYHKKEPATKAAPLRWVHRHR